MATMPFPRIMPIEVAFESEVDLISSAGTEREEHPSRVRAVSDGAAPRHSMATDARERYASDRADARITLAS